MFARSRGAPLPRVPEGVQGATRAHMGRPRSGPRGDGRPRGGESLPRFKQGPGGDEEGMRASTFPALALTGNFASRRAVNRSRLWQREEVRRAGQICRRPTRPAIGSRAPMGQPGTTRCPPAAPRRPPPHALPALPPAYSAPRARGEPISLAHRPPLPGARPVMGPAPDDAWFWGRAHAVAPGRAPGPRRWSWPPTAGGRATARPPLRGGCCDCTRAAGGRPPDVMGGFIPRIMPEGTRLGPSAPRSATRRLVESVPDRPPAVLSRRPEAQRYLIRPRSALQFVLAKDIFTCGQHKLHSTASICNHGQAQCNFIRSLDQVLFMWHGN